MRWFPLALVLVFSLICSTLRAAPAEELLDLMHASSLESGKVSAEELQTLFDHWRAGRFQQAFLFGNELLSQWDIRTVAPRELVGFVRLAELRALNSTRQSDPTRQTELRVRLTEMASTAATQTPPDVIPLFSVLLYEQLALAFALPEVSRNLGIATSFSRQALDLWAASPASEEGRRSFLRIVFFWGETGLERTLTESAYHRASLLPRQYWQDALSLAQTPEERAQAYLYLAWSLSRDSSGFSSWQRADEAFAAANGLRHSLEDPSVLVLLYGQWLQSSGRAVFNPEGLFSASPDLNRAYDLYDSFLSEDRSSRLRYGGKIVEARLALEARETSILLSSFFRPNQRPELVLRARNLPDEQAEVRLTQVRFEEVVDLSRLDHPETWRSALQSVPRPPRFTWKVSLAETDQRLLRETTFQIPQTLAPGLWLVEWGAPDYPARDVIVVTEWFAQILADHDQARVLLRRGKDGEPAAAGSLVVASRRGVYDSRARVQRWEDWTLQRHRVESLRLNPVTAPGSGNLVQWMAWSEEDELASFAWLNLNPRSIAEADPWQFHFLSDRPLYEPGETVNWRVVLRHLSDGGWAVPDSERIPSLALLHDGKEILRLEMENYISTHGVGEGSFVIPEDAPGGIYSLVLHAGSPQPRHPAFRVDRIEIPDWKVDLLTLNEAGEFESFFRRGESVTVKLETETLDGRPLADAEGELRLLRRVGFQPMPRLRSQRPWGSWNHIESFPVQTDAQGKWALPLDLPGFSDQAFSYRLELTLRDPAGITQSASHEFEIYQTAFSVKLDPGFLLFRPGDTVPLSVTTEQLTGSPVPIHGTLRLYQIRDHEVWRHRTEGRVISGTAWQALPQTARLRESRENYIREGRIRGRRQIWERALEIEASGKLEFPFSPTEEGFYSLEWVSVTERDGSVRAEASFYVAADAVGDIRYQHGGLMIIPQTRQVESGQALEGLILQPNAGYPVLLTFEADGIQHAEWVRPEGNFGRFRLPITPRLAPNAFITARSVEAFQEFRTQEEIEVSVPFQPLELSLDFEATQIRPGAGNELRLKVLGLPDDGLGGVMSVRIVDEALLRLPSFGALTLSQAFALPRRSSRVIESTLLGGLSPVFQFEGEAELLSQIAPDWEWLASIDDFKGVQPRAEAFPRAGSGMVLGRGASADAFLLEAAPSAPARFRQDSAGAADESADTPLWREEFTRSIFWQGIILPDEHGQSLLAVSAPDNLTRWVAQGSAIGPGATFGEAEASFISTIPLSLSFSIPRWLTVNDRWEFAGRLFNASETTIEGEVEWQLGPCPSSKESTLFKLAEGQSFSFTGESIFPEAGVYDLMISAQGDGESDALKRSVTVYDRARNQSQFRLIEAQAAPFTWEPVLPADVREGFLRLTPLMGPAELVHQHSAQWQRADSVYLVSALTRLFLLQGASLSLEQQAEWKAKLPGLLSEFWRRDRGWSWIKWELRGTDGSFRRDLVTEAMALWAIKLAQEKGLVWPAADLTAQRQFLEESLHQPGLSSEARAWSLFALSSRFRNQGLGRPSRGEAEALAEALRRQQEYTPSTRALFALAAWYFDLREEAQIFASTLENGVMLTKASDVQPAFAHWGADNARGSNAAVTALVLKALMTVQPDSPLIPAASTWLLRQAQLESNGTDWNQLMIVPTLLSLAARQATEDVTLEPLLLTLPGAEPLEVELPYASSIDLPSQSGEGISLTLSRGFAGLLELAFKTETDQEPSPSAGISLSRSIHYEEPIPSLARGMIARPQVLAPKANLGRSFLRPEVVLRLSLNQPLENLTIEELGLPGLRFLSDAGDRIELRRVRTADREAGSSRTTAVLDRSDRGLRLFVDSLAAGEWELRLPVAAEISGSFSWGPTKVIPQFAPELQVESASSVLVID